MGLVWGRGEKETKLVARELKTRLGGIVESFFETLSPREKDLFVATTVVENLLGDVKSAENLHSEFLSGSPSRDVLNNDANHRVLCQKLRVSVARHLWHSNLLLRALSNMLRHSMSSRMPVRRFCRRYGVHFGSFCM